MESIIIIIIGLAFSAISKSAKHKKELNAEKEKRKRQLEANPQQSSYEDMSQLREDRSPNKQKSLRQLFMDEIKKLEDEDESLGEIIRSFRGDEKPPRKQEPLTEKSTREYEKTPMDERSLEKQHLDDEEYYERLDSRVEGYRERKLKDHIDKKTAARSGPKIESSKIKDNRQYNPFSKSLNKKDIIRGIIFSEVIDKPKSLRNQKRSM